MKWLQLQWWCFQSFFHSLLGHIVNSFLLFISCWKVMLVYSVLYLLQGNRQLKTFEQQDTQNLSQLIKGKEQKGNMCNLHQVQTK